MRACEVLPGVGFDIGVEFLCGGGERGEGAGGGEVGGDVVEEFGRKVSEGEGC